MTISHDLALLFKSFGTKKSLWQGVWFSFCRQKQAIPLRGTSRPILSYAGCIRRESPPLIGVLTRSAPSVRSVGEFKRPIILMPIHKSLAPS